MVVFRSFLLGNSLKFKERFFRVEVFDFLQKLSLIFFDRVFKHVMKLNFKAFRFFKTVLGSLRSTFLELFESLDWHILMSLNFWIFLFEFIGIICICNQDIIWKRTIIDRVFSIGIVRKFFGNICGELSHVTDFLECYKWNGMPLLLSSGSSTRSVDENLMIRWIIILNHKIYWGNIETSGSHIGDNQDNVAFIFSKSI